MNSRNRNSYTQQQGAALITALVMLVLLTMLGLSTITNTTMEERMAANSQEINRAFLAASSGIDIVFNDGAAFDTRHSLDSDGTNSDTYSESDGGGGTRDKTDNSIGGDSGTDAYAYTALATYDATYVQSTVPPRGSGWDSNFAYYHFDLEATGCIVVDSTATNCNAATSATTLHQGAYQVGRAQ